MPTWFKRPRWRSKKYRQFVSSLPCCCAGCDSHPPNDPHHWHATDKGTSFKPDDWTCVPLCREHHSFFHSKGELPDMSPAATRQLFKHAQWECMGKFLSRYWSDTTHAAVDLF